MIFGQQIINLLKTTEIDFKNKESLEKLGIKIPAGYIFHDVRGELCGWDGNATSVTIPVIEDELKDHWLDVYLTPDNEDTINITYVDDTGSNIGEPQQVNVREGVTIDFADSKSLESLGINIPTGYKFKKASSNDFGSIEEGQTKFSIPINGNVDTYNITVTVEQNISTITVPVKFKDSATGVTYDKEINMDSDETYTFTTEKCREICQELKDKTSFAIYICNKWDSPSTELGNTSTSSDVKVEYNKDYGEGYELNKPESGAYIYIIAWW